MLNFIGFLGEAFPPKKTSFGGAPKGGGKPPFGGSAQGGPPAPAGNPMVGDKTAETDAAAGLMNGTDAFLAMQQQQDMKDQAAAAAAQQKIEAEDAERRQVKKMRADADAEVAAALEDKFNGDEDEIEFYPELMTFGAYNTQMNQHANMKSGDTQGQQTGPANDRGKSPTVPTEKPVKKTTEAKKPAGKPAKKK